MNAIDGDVDANIIVCNKNQCFYCVGNRMDDVCALLSLVTHNI